MATSTPGSSGTADADLLQTPTEDVTDPREVERLARISTEITAGFQALDGLGPAVSIFGSARTPRGTPDYDLARATARCLGEAGYAIITGGGPGIMEAANQGARDAGVTSVGLNIELPYEQVPNPHLDISLQFRYFFARRLMFVRYATGFVVHPGGYGTLDEMFEALTLIQTSKIERFPVVLVGSDHWSGLLTWLRETLDGDGLIEPIDVDHLDLVDEPAAVVDAIISGQDGRNGVADLRP